MKRYYLSEDRRFIQAAQLLNMPRAQLLAYLTRLELRALFTPEREFECLSDCEKAAGWDGEPGRLGRVLVKVGLVHVGPGERVTPLYPRELIYELYDCDYVYTFDFIRWFEQKLDEMARCAKYDRTQN